MEDFHPEYDTGKLQNWCQMERKKQGEWRIISFSTINKKVQNAWESAEKLVKYCERKVKSAETLPALIPADGTEETTSNNKAETLNKPKQFWLHKWDSRRLRCCERARKYKIRWCKLHYGFIFERNNLARHYQIYGSRQLTPRDFLINTEWNRFDTELRIWEALWPRRIFVWSELWTHCCYPQKIHHRWHEELQTT